MLTKKLILFRLILRGYLVRFASFVTICEYAASVLSQKE